MALTCMIFGKQNCVYCDRAKQLATDYNIRYVYRDVTDDQCAQSEFRELFPDAKTVPQIVWNGYHVGGFSEFAREIENTIGGYGEQQC